MESILKKKKAAKMKNYVVSALLYITNKNTIGGEVKRKNLFSSYRRKEDRTRQEKVVQNG